MTGDQRRILAKLAAAWELAPAARLGQLIESVENGGWDIIEQQQRQRVHSPRLLWMDDSLFEAALDRWIGVPVLRKVVAA